VSRARVIRCGLLLLLALRAASGWASEPFTLAIDIGHTPQRPGAISARGQPEYGFNKALAETLLARIQQQGPFSAFLINPQGQEIALRNRPLVASQRQAQLLLSIHHDSVQPQYLDQWEHGGRPHRYSDRFQGHSLFVSSRNPRYEDSRRFADLLGEQLLAAGLTPTLHHAERIPGENRPLLDTAKGIYLYDDLVVLREAEIPAVLLECGIILNRDEEPRLASDAFRATIAEAVIQAVRRYRAATER
jgi:N-acetylmuramoyl-L-alanine amidase